MKNLMRKLNWTFEIEEVSQVFARHKQNKFILNELDLLIFKRKYQNIQPVFLLIVLCVLLLRHTEAL